MKLTLILTALLISINTWAGGATKYECKNLPSDFYVNGKKVSDVKMVISMFASLKVKVQDDFNEYSTNCSRPNEDWKTFNCEIDDSKTMQFLIEDDKCQFIKELKTSNNKTTDVDYDQKIDCEIIETKINTEKDLIKLDSNRSRENIRSLIRELQIQCAKVNSSNKTRGAQ